MRRTKATLYSSPFRGACFAALAGFAALASASGEAEADAAVLAPHRVVYDLSLVTSRGPRGLEAARGRIAFELTGNACEGYTLNFRQVTELRGAESDAKVTDLRTANHESGDGRTFRFRNETRTDSGRPTVVDGEAERQADGRLVVKLKNPKRETLTLDGPVVFPNEQMRDLIAAAREGKTTLSEKVFDGSDDGRKVFDTLAVIGKPSSGANDRVEASLRQAPLATMTRWPVSVSYYNAGRRDETPAYVLGFDLYENGVSGALRLDYGDFSLKGEATRLDLLPGKNCGG